MHVEENLFIKKIMLYILEILLFWADIILVCRLNETLWPFRLCTQYYTIYQQWQIMTQQGNVDVCPVTKETWEARAEAKKADCGGQSVYHCLADSEGRKWEKCVEKALIKEGVCYL